MTILTKLKKIKENTPKVYESGKNTVREVVETTNTQLESILYGTSQGGKSWYDMFWDSFQDSGNRVNYSYAFYNWSSSCYDPKYSINAENVSYLFVNSQISNTNVDIKITSSNTSTNVFDSSSLNTISSLDLSDYTGLYTDWFKSCDTLTCITVIGDILNDFDIHYSLLVKDSIVGIINSLSSTTTGKTCIFNQSAVNTAFESSSGIADGSSTSEWTTLVSTKPNWTITLA